MNAQRQVSFIVSLLTYLLPLQFNLVTARLWLDSSNFHTFGCSFRAGSLLQGGVYLELRLKQC